MSSITKIVNILSAKYGFNMKEATEHVKTEIQTYKNLTKEEKDAIKEAEKQAKAAAKEAQKLAEKQAKAAAKQAQKPKAPAKVTKPTNQVQPVQKPEKNEYIVTFKNKSKKMNEEDIYFIEEDYKLDFIYQFQQTANMENIDDAEIVMYCDCAIMKGRAYLDFVKKHPDIEFDLIVFCFEQPSQMNYTFVFHDEEYEVKFHKV